MADALKASTFKVTRAPLFLLPVLWRFEEALNRSRKQARAIAHNEVAKRQKETFFMLFSLMEMLQLFSQMDKMFLFYSSVLPVV